MADVLVVIPAAIEDGELVYLVNAIRSAHHSQAHLYVLIDGWLDDIQMQAVSAALKGIAWSFVHHKNETLHGPGALRNMGLQKANEMGIPYILPLDADDTLAAGALDILLAIGRADAVTIGDVVIDGKIVQQPLPTAGGVLQGKGIPVVTALYPTHILSDLGGWREDMAGLEDVELWVRLLRAGVHVRHCKAPILRYRQRENSRRHTMGSGPWHQLRALHADLWHILHEPQYAPLATAAMMADPVLLLYVGNNKQMFGMKGPATGLRYHVDPVAGVVVERRDVPRIMNEYSDLFKIAPEMPRPEAPPERREAWELAREAMGKTDA